jgi:hypothetical protein
MVGSMKPSTVLILGRGLVTLALAIAGGWAMAYAAVDDGNLVGDGTRQERRFHVPSHAEAVTVPPADSKGDCGVTLIDESYGAHLKTPSGRAGDPLVVTGTTYRDEGGRWAPSDRVEVWWDYRWRWGPPGVDGSQRLLTIDTGTNCTFRASATVPDVEQGVYPVTTLIFHVNGYGIFGEDLFTVEA